MNKTPTIEFSENGRAQLFRNKSEEKNAKRILRFLYQHSNYELFSTHLQIQFQRLITSILSHFPLDQQNSIVHKTSRKRKYTKHTKSQSKRSKLFDSEQKNVGMEFSVPQEYLVNTGLDEAEHGIRQEEYIVPHLMDELSSYLEDTWPKRCP